MISGLFFDKHLRFIKLSDKFVPFTKLNLSYLIKVFILLTIKNIIFKSIL